LTVRMPSFHLSDEEIITLSRYFAALADETYPFEYFDAEKEIKQADLDAGKQLFDMLQCLGCHQVGTGMAATNLAPDLSFARERLQPDWIIDWLLNPQTIQPGTRMPTYFRRGRSPLPHILNGDVERQLDALRAYLLTLD
ncbi:MAG: c-type cytochrome, partial [Candidatus Binatia bacterium]